MKVLSSKKFYKYKGSLNLNIEQKDIFEVYYKYCVESVDVINIANDILDNNIILFGNKYLIEEADWLIDPISKYEWDSEVFFIDSKVSEPNYGDVKFVMELNKMGFLVSLAHAYYLTSDEKYIIKLDEYLTGWLKTVKYKRSVANKSMLDISFRCINLIQISLLCYNNALFMNEVLPIIIGILIASEKQIRKFSTPRWTKFSSGANHTIGEMVGLIVTQLWLEQFTNKSYKHFYKQQFHYLNRSLENIITPKGVYLEQSSHYSKLVTEFLVMLDITIKANENKIPSDLYKKDYLIQLLHYISTISYNDILPNFGDNDGAKVLYPFYVHSYSVSHLKMYLKFIDPDTKINKELVCEDSGQFAWKSKDINNVYVFTRAGKHSFLPLGSGSHAHNDILSLVVSVRDKPLFIDYGTYFYNSGIEILNNDRKTSNHNTISIDNIEQASLAGKWMYGSYPLSSLLDDAILVSDTVFSFKGNCTYSGRIHTRSVSYAFSEFVIIDEIKCNDDDNVKVNFLLSPDIIGVCNSKSNLSLYRENIRIALIQFPNWIKVEISESVYHPSYGIEKTTTKITGLSTISGNQEIKTIIRII